MTLITYQMMNAIIFYLVIPCKQTTTRPYWGSSSFVTRWVLCGNQFKSLLKTLQWPVQQCELSKAFSSRHFWIFSTRTRSTLTSAWAEQSSNIFNNKKHILFITLKVLFCIKINNLLNLLNTPPQINKLIFFPLLYFATYNKIQ